MGMSKMKKKGKRKGWDGKWKGRGGVGGLYTLSINVLIRK